MKLMWADRVGVFWFILASSLFFCLNGQEAISGMLSDPHAMFVLFGMPWLIMRLFDWVCGGPATRRRQSVIMRSLRQDLRQR